MATQFHPHSSSVTERVLATIADREGGDPLDLNQPLYEAIDPDALNALFESETMTGKVTFTYLDYTVVVHSDGNITLAPADG